jgi:2-dehydro-3-deoxyphosphogluconate aldolase/(4S)-4-hydroxy-2-oxoglutarate aldolase
MFNYLKNIKVIPTIKQKDLSINDAVKLATILDEMGLPALEITFRRHSDTTAIRAIREALPHFLIGAGSIMNKNQLIRAISAKAMFATSPGANIETVEVANKNNIYFSPGVCTPSELANALLCGTLDFQFFPAEQSGGIEMLKAIYEPFEHLGVQLSVRGGVTKDNLKNYLELPFVSAVFVDWVVPEALLEARAWDGIRASIKDVIESLPKK